MGADHVINPCESLVDQVKALGDEFDKGIQVGNTSSSIHGAGDYGEIIDLTVPLTVAPEPTSSILFVAGGTLLAGRRYMKRIKSA